MIYFRKVKKEYQKAIQFYKKKGFVKNGYHYEDTSNEIPAIVMERSLQ